MKKLLYIILSAVLVFSGCSAKDGKPEDPYTISAGLMDILWNVDYSTFTAARTTEFAQKYYQQDYLTYYLQDTEYNAGVAYAKETGIVSRLLGAEDLGQEKETADGKEYTIQTLRVRVAIDRFAPKDPDANYFEQGQTYVLIYKVYFLPEGEGQKIAGFSYSPEGEEMLPSSEKEPLTEGEREKIREIAKEYLDIRYNFSASTFSAEQAWDFYSSNLTERFLSRDEISKESIEFMANEYRKYNLSIRLLSTVLDTGEQKKFVYDGQAQNYYYWVKAVYQYEISAEEAFFTQKDIGKTATVTETMYFARQADGSLKMAWAEYD